jgi:hypothetical protein
MTAVELRGTAARAPISRYTLALNYLPLAQLLLGVAFVVWQATSPLAVALWALAWLYLLPPVMSRLAILMFGAPQGRALTQETRAYKVWWFTHQWQVVFNRVPWLEEILRLMPGVYALWLWLWGARVSPLVYWGPGALVIDRTLVVVEAGAVIGMGAGLAGHAGTLADGGYLIDIAAPRVGRGALMGARSGLGPGAELAAGAMLPAGRMIKPFMRWDGTSKHAVAEEDDGDA